MKVPMKWLRDYVDIEAEPREFAHRMTMSGSKAEGIEIQGEGISGVVVGRINSLEKHPDADRLQISRVDVGGEQIQVVTGAQNIKPGDLIPVALDGASLPDGNKIRRGELRGAMSEGMMCSIQELGLTKEDFPEADENGIFILQGDISPGTDIREAIGLSDVMVDFEITPNRPDCLSLLGLAREAAATFGAELKKPDLTVREEADEASAYAAIEIEAPELCPRYAARIVKDVKIGPSPKWMRERLKAAGVRPINNIVDITNFVMLELGQPMHAFDLEYLKGHRINVRRARDGETMKTLDGQDRLLDPSMLVIADAERAVAVAGVMGGENSEIKDDTRTILFESANFNGASVRRTARRLNLRTEASGRFEKGLDRENVPDAVNRAAALVEKLGAGRVCKGVIDCYVQRKEPVRIKFKPERINALLGTRLEARYMLDVLKALEFRVEETQMEVMPPSFREDVEREADLAEEVARFYDYNSIEPTLLAGKASTLGGKTRKQKIEDRIKDTMISCGLSETYTYSFTSPKVFDRLRLAQDDPLRKAVVISNPLGEDYSVMRTTTLPDMLQVLGRNYSRRVEEARLFEVSNVYIPKGLPISELPCEKPVLTLGMYGKADFFDIKGVLEELTEALGIKNASFTPESANPVFHPGRAARIEINGLEVGIIGEVHPEVAREFECPERTYAGAVDIGPLVDGAVLKPSYRQLPKYPAVTRDIALLLREDILVRQVEEIIRRGAGGLFESMELFDVYKGKQVPEGMKSVAYSITFRREDRTLTDDEVNRSMAEILKELEAKLDARLRE